MPNILNARGRFLTSAVSICLMLVITGLFTARQIKAAPPGPPIKLTAVAEQPEVTIGDWMVITLTLTNVTTELIEIIKPILDIDSISFQIKTTPAVTGTDTGKTFVYSAITPSVYIHKRNQLARVTLAPNMEAKETFRIPAATLGLWEITAHYQGLNRNLAFEPLKINVVSPSTDKTKDGELIAKIETSKGTMKCRFFFNDAPNTVMNFLRLTKNEFYNKLTFHRIMKNFMVQSGCPKGDGTGDPGYSIKAEFNRNRHIKGTLSMAHGEPKDSAGSQFFICLSTQDSLDNKYTVFGELISGLDTLEAIGTTRVVANPAMNGEMSKPTENVSVWKISLEFKETPKAK